MTKRMKSLNVWALTLAMMGVAPLAAQQAPPPPPAAQATPSGQIEVVQAQYIPGQAKPPETGAPRLNMTMDEAISRALEHNLDVQVARLNPALNDYLLQATRATYRPTMTASSGFTDQGSPNSSTLEAALTHNNTWKFNGGVSQTFKWGGNGSVSFTNSRLTTDSIQATRNPNFSSGLALSYTQSLLRNFKTDTTRTSITTQEITRQISDIQLKQSIADTIASVRNAYWDLRAGIESIEIAKQSVAQAHRLVDDNNVKVQVGTLAPLDVLNARSAEASANVVLLGAIATWQTRELAFKRLIVGGTDDDAYKATLNPVDLVDVSPVTPSIQDAVTKALAERTDLDILRRQIDSSNVTIQFQKNQVLPDLSVQGAYSGAGVGGPTISQGVVTKPGGYTDALTSVLGFNVPTWSFTFNLTMPIGAVAARATLARSELALKQSQISLKVSEFQVTTDVTTAALAISNNYESYNAATLARQLAEQNAAAEQDRFAVGLSTNYNVVQVLNTLNSARLAELNAMITYVKSLILFEKLQAVG